jgi:hypothetical protein
MTENNTVEDRRLHDLMRRSDALNAAVAAVEDWGLSSEASDETLEVLRERADEASRDFNAYRHELGLPEPGEQ